MYIVDALRGFAALCVCLMHYTNGMLPKLINPITKPLFFWGGQGVTMFFVISGFVIPYVMIQRKFELRNFGSFIGKRFVRIDPPSYISMIMTLMQWWAIDTFFHSPTKAFVNITGHRILHNMIYTVPFVAGRDYWINGVFWTLAVEYQYYFCIALLFPLLIRGGAWLWVLSAVMCLLPYVLRPIILAQYGVLADHLFFTQHACVFWMGVLTAFSFAGRISTRAYLGALAVLTGLAFHQVYVRLTDTSVPDFVTPYFYPTLALAAALLIRFVHLRTTITTFLGAISYSLYLTHGVVGTSLEVILIKLIAPTSDAIRVLHQVICVLSAIGFAYLFYRFVERPFVQLAGRLFKR